MMCNQKYVIIGAIILLLKFDVAILLPSLYNTLDKSALKHFVKWSQLKDRTHTNQSLLTPNFQNRTKTRETPASDRVLLLPTLKAAKILGAMMYMKSFIKNPLFHFDLDLPPIAPEYNSDHQYPSNSYSNNQKPPSYTYQPNQAAPQPYPSYSDSYKGYNQQPYSEEDDSDEDCSSEEESMESSEEQSSEECCY